MSVILAHLDHCFNYISHYSVVCNMNNDTDSQLRMHQNYNCLTFGELKWPVLLSSHNTCRIANDNNAIEEWTFEKGGTCLGCNLRFTKNRVTDLKTDQEKFHIAPLQGFALRTK